MVNALSMVGGRWKPAILYSLAEGRQRYSELRNGIPQVSERMLVKQLRELEHDRLVARIVHPEVPPRVEYELTERSKELLPVLNLLSDWGRKNL
ncbi:winged helix-turn-helix transcriptional regulator [Pedobacter yulinensis]|nr:winged helix-turn-helix transcriptional regulator [Pedobacter yulinensis]